MYIFIITIINRVIRKVEMFFFFQKSLNLFTCDMRKWKKNKNIRRRVLFLSNLKSISQFEKIIVHRNGTIFNIGIVTRVSTVLLTFPGIVIKYQKNRKKSFSIKCKNGFPSSEIDSQRRRRRNKILETNQVIASYLQTIKQTVFKNQIFKLTLFTIFHLLSSF